MIQKHFLIHTQCLSFVVAQSVYPDLKSYLHTVYWDDKVCATAGGGFSCSEEFTKSNTLKLVLVLVYAVE